MKTALFLLLLAGGTQERTKAFPCPDSASAHTDNGSGYIGSTEITYDQRDGSCPLRTEVRLPNVTINGEHFDWCGPTKKEITTCGVKAEKQTQKPQTPPQ
jgi:hypothetical protein